LLSSKRLEGAAKNLGIALSVREGAMEKEPLQHLQLTTFGHCRR